MAKHRRTSERARKVAVMGAATATATALTVSLAAPANALTIPGLGEVPLPVVDDILDPGTGQPIPDLADLASLIGDDGVLDLAALPGVDLADLNLPSLGSLIPQGAPLDTTLGALLDLLGVTGVPAAFDGLPIRLITTGPPFTLLKLFGVDLGWTPAIPSQIADEINTTPYASLPLIGSTRLPVVIGFGLGAFAAGLAYPAVVADLPNQPGGSESSETPLLGSVTILPMVLLRNPGRPNGGLFARFDPLAQLFGYSTVTPQMDPVDDGGEGIRRPARLLPIMIDATVEYDPLSDFPSWPNPVSLANSGAALLFPTYILRGSDLTAVAPQIAPIVPDLVANVALLTAGAGPLKPMNYYITVPQNSLPLLEPARLPFDLINLLTGLSLSNSFADAIEPALKILVNLGYTDVDQANGYDRTLDDMGTPTPFFTLPDNVNWDQVPQDVIDALVTGFEDEFFNGTPFVAEPGEALPVNALTAVLSLLNVLGVGEDLDEGALGDIGGLLDGLLDGIAEASAADSTPLAAEARSGAPDATYTDVVPEAVIPEAVVPEAGSSDALLVQSEGSSDAVIEDEGGDGTELSEDESEEERTNFRPFRPARTVLNGIRDFADGVLGSDRRVEADEDEDDTTVDDDDDDDDDNGNEQSDQESNDDDSE